MDETTNPEPGVDSTPAPEAEAYDEQPSDELADGEQSDEPAPVDDDAEEAEYEGKKFTGPKGIKEAILRQADYTRKTQEVAEQRKQVEAQAAQVQQFAQLNDAIVNDIANLRQVDMELAKYNGVDWYRLANDDPATAQVHRMRFDDAQRARVELSARLQHQHQQRSQGLQAQQDQGLAKRVQESESALASDDKTWTTARSSELSTFIQEQYGMSRDQLAQAMSPAFARLMRDAMTARKALTKATAKPPPDPVKPVTALRANTPTKPGLHDGLSTDEWMRRHNSLNRKKA